MLAPDAGFVTVADRAVTGIQPEDIARAGVGRSFQITNLFRGLPVEENIRLAVQARHPARFACVDAASALATSTPRPPAFIRLSGPRRHRARRGRLALLWGATPARHGARARRPRRVCCCSTSRSRALPPPSATRVGGLIKSLSADTAGAARRARHRPRVPDRRPTSPS